MPPVILGAAVMDTDRMIPTPQQNGGGGNSSSNSGSSPGGGSSDPANNTNTGSTVGLITNGEMSGQSQQPSFVSPLYINSANRKKKAGDRPPPPVPPTPAGGLLGHPDHPASATGGGGGMGSLTTDPHSSNSFSMRPQPPPPPPQVPVPPLPMPNSNSNSLQHAPPPPGLNHYVNEGMLVQQQQQQQQHGDGGGVVNMGFAKDSTMMVPPLQQQQHRMLHDQDDDDSDGERGGGGDQQEVIEVQILPQDDNWGGGHHHFGHHHHSYNDTSDFDGGAAGGGGGGDPGGGEGGGHNGNTTGLLIDPSSKSKHRHLKQAGVQDVADRSLSPHRCRRAATASFHSLLCALCLSSPVAMVALPALGVPRGLRPQQLSCGVDCDGALAALAFKLFALAAGAWAVFARPSRASLPRVRLFRAGASCLAAVVLAAFWLFYLSHLLHEPELVRYRALVGFASGMVDSLLFVHYLALLLLELRHRVHEQFYIKVVRSPDGESRGFSAGPMSVQRAAAWVLDKYYTEFPVYNPYLDRLVHPVGGAGGGGARGSRRGFKMYDIDGHGNNINDGNSTVVSVASKRGGGGGKDLTSADHHRMLEEFDHERKVRKRRARLLTAAEEAFTHIRRVREGSNSGAADKPPMESYEAAQAIFPTISRPLQKYLRATRQQPRHTVDSILEHLSACLSFDMSPRAFLERYLVSTPVLQNERELRDLQRWSLVSERSLYRDLTEGCTFQLRQGEVSLLCTVQRLPHFDVSEEIIEPSSNRFSLRISSETSV